MNANEIEMNSEDKIEEPQLTPKEKRAIYMSRLRGSLDSEYRRIERENNARAMRKKRLENPLYREHERRQNRTHMAEMRRENCDYRQREHIKNRHRMALKRCLHTQTSSAINNTIKSTTTTTTTTITTATNSNTNTIHSIYETLENNLQCSHISFIPYQSNFNCYQQLLSNNNNNNNKQRSEYEFLQQIDAYCRQHDTRSSSDSNSHSAGSMPSC
ncbi:unnamed protein product [Rotaria socialis]|uniref:Uncharacterized protein n=1 Tax=Rotaria socialis TaxID=392032 RepID=A0A818N8M4_9BILA|nr:unnamed protein product [Rotaria socialis]CAF3602372.1 unnamed protein product [Rotaria socialis]CAF4456527.1 unnamed protein product [Rotaria socialis]CAF4824683.1 unnamed protein product [Rotaria socialis]